MRIRATKPEFWKSRRIASTSWDARLVLKGLESYVDDNGVGVDDIELIVTDVFPRDMFAKGSETVARVSEAITELHRAGLVHRYEGPNDKLLFISFWESVQRIDKPGNGRNPRPDGTLNYKQSVIRESVASPPVTLAPVTGEQRNRGTGEQGHPVVKLSDAEAPDHDDEKFLFEEEPNEEPRPDDKTTTSGYPDDFKTFWDTYPRRGGKGAACTAFLKAKKRAPVEAILAGAERMKNDPNLPADGTLVALPATWLNQDRWEDDPLPPRLTSGQQFKSSADQRLERGAQLMEKYTAIENNQLALEGGS